MARVADRDGMDLAHDPEPGSARGGRRRSTARASMGRRVRAPRVLLRIVRLRLHHSRDFSSRHGARSDRRPAIFGWSWPVFGVAAASSTFAAALLARFIGNRRLWMVSQFTMAAGVALPVLWSGIAGTAFAALVGGTFVVCTMVGLQEARLVAGPDATGLMAAVTAALSARILGPGLVSYAIRARRHRQALVACALLLLSGIALTDIGREGPRNGAIRVYTGGQGRIHEEDGDRDPLAVQRARGDYHAEPRLGRRSARARGRRDPLDRRQRCGGDHVSALGLGRDGPLRVPPGVARHSPVRATVYAPAPASYAPAPAVRQQAAT